jgi:hypothetical protein
MNRTFVWSLAALAALSAPPAVAQSKFVGVRACAQCHDATAHGNAMASWRASPHANAFATLAKSTESAPRQCDNLNLWVVTMSHGERYGLPTRATEAKECLPCHSTAFGAGPKLLAPTFDRTEGVQCESCHGPGSAHVEAMSAGTNGSAASTLTGYADERAIQKRCGTCHDGTCGTLDFAAMWPKIKHNASRGR